MQTPAGVYTFDLNEAHPARERVLGLLTRMRREVDALWQEVSTHNRTHPISDEQRTRVSFYFGQSGGCPFGLICHIDDSCIEPAVIDENGIASLWPLTPAEFPVTTANGFVYGVRALESENAIVRWPLNGGPGEMLTRGVIFSYSGTRRLPLVVDEEYVYFVAVAVDDLDSELPILWRLPLDGSSPREASGSAGTELVQNGTHLYFTGDGNSREFNILHATESELLVGGNALERLDLTTLAVTTFDLTTPDGSQPTARWSALHGTGLLAMDGLRIDQYDLHVRAPINWLLNRGCDAPIATADGMFGRVWTIIEEGEGRGNLVRFGR